MNINELIKLASQYFEIPRSVLGWTPDEIAAYITGRAEREGLKELHDYALEFTALDTKQNILDFEENDTNHLDVDMHKPYYAA